MANYVIKNERGDAVVREDEIYDWFVVKGNAALCDYANKLRNPCSVFYQTGLKIISSKQTKIWRLSCAKNECIRREPRNAPVATTGNKTTKELQARLHDKRPGCAPWAFPRFPP